MEAVWQKLTCSTCGGQLEEKNGKLVCKYCRSVYHAIEKISEAEVIALNNATTDRNRMLFDDAQEKYDLLLKDYPDNAEANWGAFLCAYGIIYEKDYNDEYKPTCHRLNECPVKKSPYYAKLTDENKKRADEIEELRLKILDEVKKIQPYDVFICYKQNEDKASENAPKIPTRESKWARDIYEMLSRDLGLKVFFAEKSLSGTNVDYEPHIYAALRSAKLMIVLASSIEHVNAVWVKNEWKRYAKYIREGENKTLRVVYDGIEPYELPKELQNKQAICHDDINWNESLANSVRELFNAAPSLETREIKTKEYTKKERGHGAVVKTTLETFVPTVIPPTENGQLDNAEDLLRLKKFNFAKMTLQTVLAANRASKRAWLDMFLCENGYTDVGAFTSAANTIKDFKSFENALASAQKESEKEELIDLFIARIQGTPTLNLYQEYIRLPHTTPSQDEKALQVVYTQSVNTCDTALFDCLIESVADTDRYIDWNFSFGKQVYLEKGAKVAEKYFNAVLQYDEGHQETLLYKYIAKLGVKDENAFVQACLKLKDYGEIEKIYEYGYFTRLSKLLLDGSLVAIKAGNVANAVRLIDFLLSIIPKGENSRYLNSLDLVVDALFSAKAYAHLNKYLNSVLVLSPDNHEAYFQRVMVKYKVNNAYSLIKVMDKLMEEQDFSNAMNTYAKLYPAQKNLYMQLYTQYDYISGLLKKYGLITVDEFAKKANLDTCNVEELAKYSIKTMEDIAAQYEKDKRVDMKITSPMVINIVLFAIFAVFMLNYLTIHTLIDINGIIKMIDLIRLIFVPMIALSVILIICSFSLFFSLVGSVKDRGFVNSIKQKTSFSLVCALTNFVVAIISLYVRPFTTIGSFLIFIPIFIWGQSVVYLLLDWNNAALKTPGKVLAGFADTGEKLFPGNWLLILTWPAALCYFVYGGIISLVISVLVPIIASPIYYIITVKERNKGL